MIRESLKYHGFFALALLLISVMSCKDTTSSSPPPEFEGVVLESGTANPISDAVVSINNRKDTTGTDGKYSFPKIEVGTFIMSVIVKGYKSVNDTVKIDNGYNYLKVELEKSTTGSGSSTTTLSGKVTGSATNDPISKVVLSIDNKKDTTGQDGSYQFDNLPPGDFTFTAAASGYTSYSRSITIKSGNNVLDLQLNKKGANTGSLAGVIHDSQTGDPVVKAVVTIDNKKDTTGQDGSYQFDNLPPGDFTFTATASGYTSYSRSITINTGNNVLDLQLNKKGANTGSLAGVIHDSQTGDPVVKAVVTIDNKKDTTGQDGSYQFDNLPPGDFTFTATASGYTSYSRSITINTGNNVLDLQLNKKGANTGSLAGVIHDSQTGDPVVKAVVTIDNKKDTTGQDGSYQFDNLPPGDFTFTATASGYTSYSRSITINTGNNVLDLQLNKKGANTGSLAGVIHDSQTGDPVVKAVVTIDNKKDTTGQDGKYEFKDLNTGTYPVLVNAPDYKEVTQSVTINRGQNSFNIEINGIGTLSGTVTEDGSGTKIPGVVVELNGKKSTTDQNGNYSINSVMVGSYNVTAKNDKYNDYTKSIDIKKGANKLDITMTPKQQFANVQGTVSNGNGDPVNGALVILAGNQKKTDNSGYYQFQSIPQGQYDLKVTKDGYKDYQKAILLTTSEVRYDIVMTMSPIAPPQNLSIEKAKDTEIKVSWDPVKSENLEGYNVYNIMDQSGPVNGKPIDVNVASYTADKLHPGIYSYRVTSVNLEQVEGNKSTATDSTFIYNTIHSDNFDGKSLDLFRWSSTERKLSGFSLTSDSRYVIDGKRSLLHTEDKSRVLYSSSMVPSQSRYTATVKVKPLATGSIFELSLDNGQSGGSSPAVWLEVDGAGKVSIGYKDAPKGTLNPSFSYGDYANNVFKIGLFVDTSSKRFCILVNDIAVYTSGYSQDNLNRLYLYFQNKEAIDDIVTGSVE